MGQMLWANYNPQNENPVFNWLAQFDPGRPQTPTGGILYYITSPRSLDAAAQDPARVCGLRRIPDYHCNNFRQVVGRG